jgi:hypothetical protein
VILAIQENLVAGETVADRLAAALDAGVAALELRDAARAGLEPARGLTETYRMNVRRMVDAPSG